MRYLRLCIPLLLMMNLAFAQSEVQNALLWKVSKGDQEAYLYGTIHISCNAELSPDVEKALKESDELILEIDMSDPSLQMRMMQKMVLPDGKNASDFLTDKELESLEEYVNENVKMIPSFAMVSNMKPIFLSSLITQSLLSCQNQTGYDQLLLQKAQQQNMPISGLETIDEQISALDGIPHQEVYDEIIASIEEDQQEDIKMLDKMMQYYNNANLKALKKLFDESDSFLNDFTDIALDKRNKNWIPVIKEKMKGQKVFIAFGAAHLIGENGVVELLKDEGYKVSPLN